MKPIKDENYSAQAMFIVEKYETFVRYIYPMLINLSGKHRVLRDKALEHILGQFLLFNDAGKTSQISRLYLADSGLSTIRDYLRMLSDPNVKLLSKRQYEVATTLLANIYGHILDRHLAHGLRVKKWARYMDDTVIFGESREELEEILKDLTVFIEKEMKLEWSKWSISPTSKGVNFLGYRIWSTHKLVRPDSVRRAKRKIKKYQENNETEKLSKFIASWSGHIKWANSFNLKTKLLGSVA